MTQSEFEELLAHGESTTLDWKVALPAALAKGKRDDNWDAARAEMLKDIVCVANEEGEQFAHLIYGVHDHEGHRKVVGIDFSLDDADIQQWSEYVFAPPPKFIYTTLALNNGKRVGIAKIERIAEYPHFVRCDLGGVLHEGQVWFRRGSKNTVAGREELFRMQTGHKPFTVSRSDDKNYKAVVNFYLDQGLELTCWPLVDKESKMLQGYQIAYYPGTRREVHKGGPSTERSILMIKPH